MYGDDDYEQRGVQCLSVSAWRKFFADPCFLHEIRGYS
jgi:hypothetical protein